MTGLLTLEGPVFRLAGATLGSAGGTGTLAAANGGGFEWTSGYLQGMLTLSNGVSSTFYGPAEKWFLDNTTLHNYGTVTWTGGLIRGQCLNGPVTFHHHAGARLLCHGGAGFGRQNYYQYGYVQMDAGAEFVKTDAGDATADWWWQNNGALAVAGGTWRLSSGGDSAGSFTNLADTTLELSGGTHWLRDGARFAGPGTVVLSGGQVPLSGLLTLEGPVFRLAGATAGQCGWDTARWRRPTGAASSGQAGNVQGTLTLSNGVSSTFYGTAEKWFLDNTTLHNYGTVTWSGGLIRGQCLNGPVTFHHHAGARFLCQGGAGFGRNSYYQSASFRNDGTLVLGVPGGQVSGDWQFAQSGSGVFTIVLAGTNTPSAFGRWTTTGYATIGGSLRAELTNGFVPATGQAFPFLNAAFISDAFATNDLPVLPGLTWFVDQTAPAVTLRVAEALPCVAPPSGLVGWWSGDGHANDLLGTNHGILRNGATATASGMVGQAFSLDGNNDFVEIPNAPSLNPTNAITVEAWYRPVSFAGDGATPIVGKSYVSHTPPHYQYHLSACGDLYPTSSKALFGFHVAAGGSGTGTSTPNQFWTAGEWYHVVGTYDGSAVKLYVNGALVGSNSASGSLTDYGQNVRIGAHTGLSTPRRQLPARHRG